MKPTEIRPWRQSPFIVGATYRVRDDFIALRNTFRAGEVITFTSDAYSRYDGITGYFFSQPQGERLRVWDVADDDRLDAWQDFFEQIDAI